MSLWDGISMQPLLMGIVNITPDSFSDGHCFLDPGAAIAHAERLRADGADIIDLGAESTRPGAAPTPEAEQWRRLEPVLKGLSGRGYKLSLDTTKPSIMRRALAFGICMINDVEAMAGLVLADLQDLAAAGVSYVAMHGWHEAPSLDAFAYRTQQRLKAAGFAPDAIWIDPGIGFAKDDRANLLALRWAMQAAGAQQIAVGVSRKSMIGRLLDLPTPIARDAPSKMLELGLLLGGVQLIRTHNIAPLKAMTLMLAAT